MMPRLSALVLLLAVLRPLPAQTPEAVTIIYLRHLQTEDGSFLPAKGEMRSSLRATSAALRALRYMGGTVPKRDKCMKFVAACFDRATGGFTDRPGEGKPDVFTTAIGLMAVVELKMPAGAYENPARTFLGKNAKSFEEVRIAAAGLEAIGKSTPETKEWLALLASMRNRDGTYGKGADQPRATGGAVAAQLRLGEKVSDPEAVLKLLRAEQREDGGYGKADAKGSDLETTYRVVRALVMLQARPDAMKLKGFIERCRNDDGGHGVAPGAKSSVAGTYFASILRHWISTK